MSASQNFPTGADLIAALRRSNEAVFLWTPGGDDALTWCDEAIRALRCPILADCNTGAGFSGLLDHESAALRAAWVKSTAQRRGLVTSIRIVNESDGSEQWFEERLERLSDETHGERFIGFVRDITERRNREARLAYLALFDELTGVLSRPQLRAILADRIAEAETTGTTLAYAAIGVDKVSSLNAALGYDVTDEAIVAVGRRIEQHVGPRDVIGRIAGSKFGLILDGCDRDCLAARLTRIRHAIRSEVIDTFSGPVPITASAGGVVLPIDAHTTHDAFAVAEDALASAKAAGVDGQRIFAKDTRALEVRRCNMHTADEIVAALNEDRFRLAFQPIVDSRNTGVIAFHEALLRMIGRDGTLLSAGAFMPVAEQLGLVRWLDREVVRQVFATLAAHPRQRISFNLSPQSLRDPEWFEVFEDELTKHPDIADRLIIEITEATALEDSPWAVRAIDRLRKFGASTALDDFGAGYTSFSQLERIEFDIVKIDGSFVRGIEDDRRKRQFVKALSKLAQSMDVLVVAEMVETEAVADILRTIGADAFQGYLYGKPDVSPQWLSNGAQFGKTATAS